jgi:hypothetical protein
MGDLMSSKYEIVTWRGCRFDRYTVAAIQATEARLGFQLRIFQGSYNVGRVTASAGTHDGGGAVDVAATSDPARVVRALRAVGFAAWHRPELPGVWGEHIHAILIGNTKAAPSALRQVTAYRNHRDGLASNAPDNTWHPDPIPTFIYPEEADMALLADLTTVAKKHGVSRLYAARILLRAAAATAKEKGRLRRLARINTARTALKGMR